MNSQKIKQQNINMTGSSVINTRHFILVLGRWLCGIAKQLGIGSRRRDILFVAESRLMISYLKEVWQCLKDDDRLCLRVAFDNEIDPKVIVHTTASFGNGIRCIHYWAAMIWPWDLIVFADCTTAWKSFSEMSAKLKIQHGLQAGKLSRNGKDVYWGEWLFKDDQTPAFDKIFVSSDREKIYVETVSPEYRDRIDCVGDIRFDNLIEACRKQNQIKKELNIPEGKKVVLVVSSWGPNSLLHTIGKQLYEECLRLADVYHFIISAHPNNYDRDRQWMDVIQQQMSWGATIVQPTDDWVRFMAVADILVTDYTSMSLYFVPLLRPIVSIPIPVNIGSNNAAMYKMESIAARLQSPDKLREVLGAAFSFEIGTGHKEFAGELVSCKGQARFNVRREIYELLSLNETEIN
ncbi:MAG: CDP-glycerol glycerophosphotransferase family protein [Sedimentisphaerales bacterium]|nr:CDP-glycerol glycerophosphotransferase family protein [Sedimentisphaerales bacterium]